MSAEREALNYFGNMLVKFVRDPSIDVMVGTVKGESKSVRGRVHARQLASLPKETKDLVEELVRDAVDSTIHHLLWRLEEEENVRINVHVGGTLVEHLAEKSDGLAGEYEGKEGWKGQYSKHPIRQ